MLKQEFEVSPVLATELKTLFSTVNYFTPILGAYVADRYLGRFVSLMYSYEFLHEYTSTHCMTTFAFTRQYAYYQMYNTRHIHVPHTDFFTSLCDE